MDRENMTHHVGVYADGKWIGYLTSRGTTNRLSVHAAFFSEARARAVAAEIDAQHTEERLTGKAIDAWKGRKPR